MICFHNYKTRGLKVTAADYWEIKIAKEEDAELTSSHEQIKNTSTRGVILTDCLLDTNKSHIESKLPESSPCTGRVKIKGIRMRQSYTPGRDL